MHIYNLIIIKIMKSKYLYVMLFFICIYLTAFQQPIDKTISLLSNEDQPAMIQMGDGKNLF